MYSVHIVIGRRSVFYTKQYTTMAFVFATDELNVLNNISSFLSFIFSINEFLFVFVKTINYLINYVRNDSLSDVYCNSEQTAYPPRSKSQQ